jgi:hypothetical protein
MNNNFDATKEKQLILIDKTELRNYWELVRPGLVALQAEQETADKWIPEELYASIAGGNSSLVFCSMARQAGMTYKDRDAAIKDSCGFCILQKASNFKESALHIWVCCSNEHTNKNGAGSVMRTFNQELSDLATTIGCTAITFSSNRNFWLEIGPRFGFEINEIRYRKDIK